MDVLSGHTIVDGLVVEIPLFINWLVVEPTPLKNMLVKLEIFPK